MKTISTIRALIGGALLIWACGVGVTADPPLPEPKGPVLLTVSGKIGRGNGSDPKVGLVARFDREMLEALEQAEMVTETPWYEGDQRFQGVKASALIAAVRATGETARAIALNDYVVEIPTSDWRDDLFVLSMKRNGEVMTVRQKGPLFAVYQYKGVSKERSSVLFNRSIWQLSRVEFK